MYRFRIIYQNPNTGDWKDAYEREWESHIRAFELAHAFAKSTGEVTRVILVEPFTEFNTWWYVDMRPVMSSPDILYSKD